MSFKPPFGQVGLIIGLLNFHHPGVDLSDFEIIALIPIFGNPVFVVPEFLRILAHIILILIPDI